MTRAPAPQGGELVGRRLRCDRRWEHRPIRRCPMAFRAWRRRRRRPRDSLPGTPLRSVRTGVSARPWTSDQTTRPAMDRYEDVKLRIKEATDLVALIESYIPLRQRGRDYMARCPFHAENTASFSVSREKQFFHCFGCGKTGDVFTWLMERDGLSFVEAMQVLADRAGISLEGVLGQRNERPRRRGPDPFVALDEVAAFFGRKLDEPAGAAARDYLVGRGLADAIEPWRLGFHPETRGALVEFARERKLPRQVLEDAGLVRGDGKEPFAGRVMFPILDERGRTVAFGGRVVPGSRFAAGNGDYKPPKYLNSPESPIFNKRRVLFGLPHVKRAAERRLLVMEGYTDVIACHLAGFHGAVATLGTAFTADHARLVERYAHDGLVLMFDGDRAGRTAAARAMRELVNTRLQVRMAVMSDAGEGVKDPADLLVARPGDDPELVAEQRVRFADIVDAAEDSLTVWFRLLRDRLDLNDAVGIEAAANECVGILQLVENPVKRAALRQAMASHLAVPEPTLARLMARAPRQRVAADEPPPEAAMADGSDDRPDGRATPPVPRTLRQRAEAELLACVLARPAALLDPAVVGDAPFEFAPAGELLALAGEGVELGRGSSNELVQYLFARVAEQPALQSVLAVAARRSETLPEVDAVLAGIVHARARMSREPERRALRQQLAQALAAGDRERADALQARLLSTMRLDRPRAAEEPSEPTRTPLPEVLSGASGLSSSESPPSESPPSESPPSESAVAADDDPAADFPASDSPASDSFAVDSPGSTGADDQY
ncbi:MAG: DNA primase [Planctomycetes bacterium]|nr:DNA primase [Planctomycetota bacterium]